MLENCVICRGSVWCEGVVCDMKWLCVLWKGSVLCGGVVCCVVG